MKFSRMIPLFIVLLFSLSSLRSSAQVGVYAEGNLANLTGLTHNGASNIGWVPGATIGGYGQAYLTQTIDLGADIRGQFFNRNDSNYDGTGLNLNTKLDSFLIGPRIAFKKPSLRLQPYAEFLFGLARESENFSADGQAASVSGTGSNIQFLAGADYAFSPLLTWRILEVGYGRASADVSGDGITGNISSNPVIFSTGIVLVLPHK